MNANRRELVDEKLCWLVQHTAYGRLGRRVATRKTLPQRFLIATTASRVFQQSISDHQCPSVVKNLIRNIRVHSRPFAVSKMPFYGPS
jgi:hypothetical protein